MIIFSAFMANIVQLIKSRRLRQAGHVARIEESRRAYKMLTGKPKKQRLIGRPRRRWEDNMRMYLKEIAVNTKDYIDSAHERIIGEPL